MSAPTPQREPPAGWWKVLLWVAVILAGGWLVWKGILLLQSWLGKGGRPSREVQIVQIVRPPPPPPDTPPPPPPPPDKVDEPLPQDAPEPSPADEAAPSEQLGLDAEGGAGGDAFGLAARKGGREITGGGGAVFAWYTQILKDALVERLSADKGLRTRKFTIVVKVWIAPDGQVHAAKLVTGSGNREVDTAIEAVLTHLGRLREAPPLEMPQPVSLKIVSRS